MKGMIGGVSHYIPEPRYSKEHREQSKRENRPLFTMDLWVPKQRRMTSTGVLSDEAIDEAIERLQRVKAGKWGYEKDPPQSKRGG